MAVDDLDILRSELPNLFLDIDLPVAWEEDWVFVKIDKPEDDYHAAEALVSPDHIEALFESQIGEQEHERSGVSGKNPDFGVIMVPDFGSNARFPGYPDMDDFGDQVPPPDCLAFYLPFHYFHPVWWGVYLIIEGVQGLATFVQRQAGGILTYQESVVVARLFLYGHEVFHHIVESFATRLEISHRRPLYKTGFDELYQKAKGTENWIEEALASANGYRKVQSLAFRDPNNPQKRQAALEAVAEYIRRCPPGYNRAHEFFKTAAFNAQRSAFAEDNHRCALPEMRPCEPHVWDSFPHAFSGISRVHSRVNYAIYRNSPLCDRVQSRGHFFPNRKIALQEKLSHGTV